MSGRTRKVESQLKEITGEEVAALSDPRIQGLVTITGVRVSPDLAHATVFYSVLAGEDEAAANEGLQSAAGPRPGRGRGPDATQAHAQAALRARPCCRECHQDRSRIEGGKDG